MQPTMTNNSVNNGHLIEESEETSHMNGNAATMNGKLSTTAGDVVQLKNRSDREIVRLIGQHLRDLGLDQTAELLSQESGCKFDHPSATRFKMHVIDGLWTKAENDLNDLQKLLDDPLASVHMKFLILEQKYLECLDEGRVMDALQCLRTEMSTLNHQTERVHELSRFIMCSTSEELRKLATWEGKGISSRKKLMEKLQNYLPPSIMLPPRRLQVLLNQSLQLQKERCPYHNFLDDNFNLETVSLLVDHVCSKEDFPCETRQVLTDHCDEVLYCQFSNDGTKLATGSKDGTVIIWEVNPSTLQLKHRYSFENQQPIHYLTWSSDDRYLMSCGPANSIEIIIWNAELGELKTKFTHTTDDYLTACCWQKDSHRFFCGGPRGSMYYCDINGGILGSWEGVRVQSMCSRKNSKVILVADHLQRIRDYHWDSKIETPVAEETHPISCFTLDETGDFALVNLETQGIHLWDLNHKNIVRTYKGLSQSNFIVHSCFGGVNQNFISSGSEDNKVYVWHRDKENPIAVFSGHSRTVNCVSWNPKYPQLLASASDDSTVRIWAPQRLNPAHSYRQGRSAAVAHLHCQNGQSGSCCISSLLTGQHQHCSLHPTGTSTTASESNNPTPSSSPVMA